MVEDWAFSHKIDYVLLNGWNLPIGEASAGKGLRLQPAQQALKKERNGRFCCARYTNICYSKSGLKTLSWIIKYNVKTLPSFYDSFNSCKGIANFSSCSHDV